MSLDREIDNLRNVVMMKKEIDVINNDDFFSSIMSSIGEEADRLKRIPIKTVVSANESLNNSSRIRYAELIKYDGEDFIENIYRLVLGRNVDDEGRRYYSNLLNSGQTDKHEIVAKLALSDEAISKGVEIVAPSAPIVDAENLLRLNKESFVIQSYIWLLGRKPDKQSLNNNLNALDSGIYKEQLLYGITKSDEFKRRNIYIRGLKKKYYKKLIRYRLKQVPFLGRIIRHNDYIYYERLAAIENLQKQSGEIAILRNQLQASNKSILELSQSNDEMKRCLKKVGEENVELKNQLLQCNENIERNSITLDSIGLNIRNNNILVAKHDDFYDEYHNNDKRILQSLSSEVSNIKAGSYNCKGSSAVSHNEVSINTNNSYSTIDYFDFENHFRGDRKYVMNSQKMYLKYFEGKKNVLDLGCGRGEFTELLHSNNVGVTGVELYAPYVEYLKMMNLPAAYGDAVEYLRNQEKVDGIFMGQVVEHISVGQIDEICRLAYEKLDEGSYLIMETPNPMSLAIFTECFYIDPSHEKPVHPKTLKYMAEKAGFSSVEIVFTEGSRLPYNIPEIKGDIENITEFNEAMNRIENLLYGSQDYAVIAQK